MGDPFESDTAVLLFEKKNPKEQILAIFFRQYREKGVSISQKADLKKMEQVRVTTLLDLQMWKEEFSSC